MLANANDPVDHSIKIILEYTVVVVRAYYCRPLSTPLSIGSGPPAVPCAVLCSWSTRVRLKSKILGEHTKWLSARSRNGDRA